MSTNNNNKPMAAKKRKAPAPSPSSGQRGDKDKNSGNSGGAPGTARKKSSGSSSSSSNNNSGGGGGGGGPALSKRKSPTPSVASKGPTTIRIKPPAPPGGPTAVKVRREKKETLEERKESQKALDRIKFRQSLPKVLLHEMAAQKYATFLAESQSQSQHRPGANGHRNLNLLPLSYYRRPRRKRQRPDMAKALVMLRVPSAGQAEGYQFASEWRKPMTIEPEQLGAFFKPGGGVIEPTLQPPPELRLAGIQGKDLNQGYLNYVEPDTTSSVSEISEMLDETPGLEREEESAHFITYRNNLNKILVTPYSKQKWEMEVFKEGGVIHLEVVMTNRNQGKLDRTSYWGRRFETLCVLGVEGSRLDDLNRPPEDPARASYCGLYRSRLGSHNLLMGAEIDACRPGDPGRFVEIKTTRIIREAKDEQIFKKHKTLKYWAQCYLAGVRDIVLGYRDDQGIVRDIKSWTTDGLVDSVDKIKHWDKDVCLNFADRCLSFLKDNVDEGPRYSFKYVEPFDHCALEQIHAGGGGGSDAAATVAPGSSMMLAGGVGVAYS